jgi:hypothetical protein
MHEAAYTAGNEEGCVIKSISRIIFVFAISGCIAVPHKTAEEVQGSTQIVHDQFKNETIVKGPVFPCSTTYRSPKDYGCQLFLRSHVKVKRKTLELYVTYYGDDWVFFNNASYLGGEKLGFIPVDQSVVKKGGGIIREDFILIVDAEYAKIALNSSLMIQARGNRGSLLIDIPSYYFQGFMNKYSLLEK